MVRIRIGSRGSDLALFQAKYVQEHLDSIGIRSKITVIKTHGDRVVDKPLRELGVQGVFTRELEDALLENRIDLAVHSLKDMALAQPDKLVIAAITDREDPADMLIISKAAYNNNSFIPLEKRTIVGTSAVRRQEQLRAFRPEIQVKDLRGNLPTRLRKLSEGQYSAIFLAAAGVKRLGLDLTEFVVIRLDPTKFIPSPGQGALAIEMRKDSNLIPQIRELLHNEETSVAVKLERSVLAQLGGGCGLPLGAYAFQKNDEWQVYVFWGKSEKGPVWVKAVDSDPVKLEQVIRKQLM